MDVNIGVRKIENGYILAVAGSAEYDLIGTPLIERHYPTIDALAADLPDAISEGFVRAEKQRAQMASQRPMYRYQGEALGEPRNGAGY